MPSSTHAYASSRFSLRHAGSGGHRRYVGPGTARGRQASRAGLGGGAWVARLRRALAEDLFALRYQPIVSLTDGRVSHHEALVRLADEPDGRLVLPGAFLPAAERHGLIREIDLLVLERAIALLARAGERGGGAPAVAVNLSALSVTDPRMLARVEGLLGRRAVDPARLVIELTETSAISDMRRARDFCAGAQRLGCAIALDDFGAGFGSFQYLKHLPFTYLKIDGGFIRGLTSSRTDQLVVSALVQLAHGMGRRTIAEFVADSPTLQMVAEHGVDLAQGYAIGPPVHERALVPRRGYVASR
ncbi:MAG TPA: EAL domain-containing protein [Solirubrobacteraceae bacterium]|nr:EAL domain-containing protein [Solirubrobacteraceae bacterium]